MTAGYIFDRERDDIGVACGVRSAVTGVRDESMSNLQRRALYLGMFTLERGECATGEAALRKQQDGDSSF